MQNPVVYCRPNFKVCSCLKKGRKSLSLCIHAKSKAPFALYGNTMSYGRSTVGGEAFCDSDILRRPFFIVMNTWDQRDPVAWQNGKALLKEQVPELKRP